MRDIMKKILLASTMLASVAGYAAADVSVSGDSRMGVVTTDGYSVFSSRVRIKFSGSGVTDGGLSFGGSFRAKEASDADAGTKGSTYISGAFGKISMGDVDGGDKASVGQLSSVGYEGLLSGNSISYVSDGGLTGLDKFEKEAGVTATKAAVLYTYSAGAVTVNASTAQLSNGGANRQAYGLGAVYAAGDLTLAVGYGTKEITGEYDDEVVDGSITDISASAKYKMGSTAIKAIYQDKSAQVSWDGLDFDLGSAVSMGLSVDHTIDVITVTAYTITTEVTSDLAEVDASVSRMGVGVAYDLGGGAVVKAGWAEVETLSGDETTTKSLVDAGVSFSF